MSFKTDILKTVKFVSDFPKPGINFVDLNPLYANPALMNRLVRKLVPVPGVQALLAFEARGFLLGMALSRQWGIPLILVRKPGKMPGDKYEATGAIEYGTNTFEVQTDLLKGFTKVAMVDDLIATGGTIKICQSLCEQANLNLTQVLAIWKIKDLAPSFPSLTITTVIEQ